MHTVLMRQIMAKGIPVKCFPGMLAISFNYSPSGGGVVGIPRKFDFIINIFFFLHNSIPFVTGHPRNGWSYGGDGGRGLTNRSLSTFMSWHAIREEQQTYRANEELIP